MPYASSTRTDMPSRSGSGRGSPSDREKRASAARLPGVPNRVVRPRAPPWCGTTRRAWYTAPCGCTALPRLSAARPASAPPIANPAASTARRRGPLSPRRAFSPIDTGAFSAVARHLATPCAGLRVTRLDELLEPLKVALDAPSGNAKGVAEFLLEALGHEVHLDGEAGRAVVDLVERHDARVVLAVGVAPSHAILGMLLDDLC